MNGTELHTLKWLIQLILHFIYILYHNKNISEDPIKSKSAIILCKNAGGIRKIDVFHLASTHWWFCESQNLSKMLTLSVWCSIHRHAFSWRNLSLRPLTPSPGSECVESHLLGKLGSWWPPRRAGPTGWAQETWRWSCRWQQCRQLGVMVENLVPGPDYLVLWPQTRVFISGPHLPLL